MKREIKFRAWDIPAKKYRGVDGLKDLFSIRSDGFFNEDYVLEQFTGLLDKNGKEIYEGDIVNFGNKNNVNGHKNDISGTNNYVSGSGNKVEGTGNVVGDSLNLRKLISEMN